MIPNALIILFDKHILDESIFLLNKEVTSASLILFLPQ